MFTILAQRKRPLGAIGRSCHREAIVVVNLLVVVFVAMHSIMSLLFAEAPTTAKRPNAAKWSVTREQPIVLAYPATKRVEIIACIIIIVDRYIQLIKLLPPFAR